MELLSEADLSRRATFPDNVDNREIACHLAARVFEKAVEEKLKIGNKDMLEIHAKLGNKGVKEYINSKMWYPTHKPLAYQQQGRVE